jgi:DNA replication protein DnaC
LKKRDLLGVIEDRRGTRSTILTGQLPVENWQEHTGDPTIAGAILHRWIQNTHRINLEGGSGRRNFSPGNRQG